MRVADKIRAINKLRGAKAFNEWARDARANGDTEALQLAAINLAHRQRNWRRGRVRYSRELSPSDAKLSNEMVTVGEGAGCAFATEWQDGDFYTDCGKAISNAMDEWLRAGHGQHDNTWRGAYSTDARKFSSQITESLLVHNAELMDTDNTEPEYIDEQGQRDKEADRITNADATAAAEVSENNAEAVDGAYNSLDNADAANPKADPDKAFGVDGATRGIGTGTLRPSTFDMMHLAACERLRDDYPKVWEVVRAVDKTRGGEERYIAQGRQHRRNEILQTLAFAHTKIREWRADLLAQSQEHEIEAVYEPDPDLTMKPVKVAAGEGPRGVVLTNSWTNRPDKTRPRGVTWQPYTRRGALFTVTVSGQDRSAMRRNLKRWQRHLTRYKAPEGIAELYWTLFLEAYKKR